MQKTILACRDLTKLESLHFQTIIAETKPDRECVVRVVVDPGVQALLVLLQPALPAIY